MDWELGMEGRELKKGLEERKELGRRIAIAWTVENVPGGKAFVGCFGLFLGDSGTLLL